MEAETNTLQDTPPQANLSQIPDCLEEKIPTLLYDEMWRFLCNRNPQLNPEHFSASENKLPVNILHAHFGTGKALLPYAGHQLITAYSNNHYWNQFAKTKATRFMRPFFGDIADLFLFPGAGRQKKYDLIISVPEADNDNYHSLDGEKEFAGLSVYEYYSYRPQYLLRTGGYLCVIMPTNEVVNVSGEVITYKKNNSRFNDHNCFVDAQIRKERCNYSVLIFKKYEGSASQNGSNNNIQLPEEYTLGSTAQRVEIINYVRERLSELDGQSYPKIASFIKDVNNRTAMVFMLIAEIYNGSVGFIDFDQALTVIEAKF